MAPGRREFLLSPLAAAACTRRQSANGWPKAWDRLLLEKEVRASDFKYDPDQRMISAPLGPEYRYHTRLRECRAHPTRDSLSYALFLLDEGSAPRRVRAQAILERVLPLQVTDPDSQWYGLWGWYLEEPPGKMAPADWNWADFNGSTLLLVERRHGAELGEALRGRVRLAISHAARSIVRRNVSMLYTNIAVKGTFVTLAAAELLGDGDLAVYARDRTQRLCAAIDETGSFAEYNSPAYAAVALTDLTRIRMYVRDEEARRRAASVERRLWLHLAAHWDAGRKQFAGPMSRCYADDLGYPSWLEKALDGRLGLVNPRNRSGADGDTAIHDYHCPGDLAGRFLSPQAEGEHRELFLASPPTSGTTYFCREFSLGSVDRGEFWIQRRPLLAYFGDDSRPPRTVRLRVVKDGYDFSSALFFSVQEAGRVLGLINFRNPGGNRHITLDPIENGEFDCGRLFVELSFDGLSEGFRHQARDEAVEVQSRHLQARFRLLDARWGHFRPRLSASASAQSLTATIDLKPADAPKRVRWRDVGEAWAAFALELAGPRAALNAQAPSHRVEPGRIHLLWGSLELSGATGVTDAARLNAAFRGQPDRGVRLSDDRLA